MQDCPRACPAKPCLPDRQAWRSRGVSLIDALMSAAVLVTISLGLFAVLQLSIRESTDTKARSGALMLANEQVEFLHSLAYADVGVGDNNKGHGNDPDGYDEDNPGGTGGGGNDQDLLMNRATHVTLNGIQYTRRTYVHYIDDAADGLANHDNDHDRNDYKFVKVEVSWESRGVAKSVTLVSNITPDF